MRDVVAVRPVPHSDCLPMACTLRPLAPLSFISHGATCLARASVAFRTPIVRAAGARAALDAHFRPFGAAACVAPATLRSRASSRACGGRQRAHPTAPWEPSVWRLERRTLLFVRERWCSRKACGRAPQQGNLEIRCLECCGVRRFPLRPTRSRRFPPIELAELASAGKPTTLNVLGSDRLLAWVSSAEVLADARADGN